MYKTGDLCRLRNDGQIEFLGRLDHQVKIRGHRIELGEIEAQLAESSAVQESVVVAREVDGNGSELVAYLVFHPAASLGVPELRGFLQQHLPGYMIPSHFVVADRLPRQPNGKVDRKALPKVEIAAVDAEAEPVAGPRNELENVLREYWSENLHRPPDTIGIHENFFELGGHSLLITRILSRIRQDLEVDLSMRAVFQAPTIAALAQAVEQALLAEEPEETERSTASK
jgi:acyl carrier protein